MGFRVKNLPVINGERVKGFRIKADVLGKKTICLRKDMTLSAAAETLKVDEKTFSDLGIIKDQEIDVGVLRKKTADTTGFLGKIALRKGERYNPDHLACVVISRLGDEEEVLDFNIISALKANPPADKQAALLCNYVQYLCPHDPLVAQKNMVLRIIKELYPDDLSFQISLLASVAKRLYGDNQIAQEDLVLCAAKEFYPNEPAIQGKLIASIAIELFPNDPIAREDLVIKGVRELHPNDLEAQGELIASAIKELYPNDLTSQKSFGSTAILVLCADNPIARENLLLCIIKKLYPDKLETQIDFVNYLADLLHLKLDSLIIQLLA